MRPGWRLLAIGGVFAGLLAVLILRMWYLQVTVPLDALQAAESQQIRVVSIAAPRGDILDSKGIEVMAGTRAALRVVVDRQLVPTDDEDRLVQNLAALLDTPAVVIRGRFEAAGSGARFLIGDEISQSVGVFVLEHIEDFPGVSIEALPVRLYPLGESAAHIVGYIGAPQESDLERPDVSPRDQVGKFGVERTYDRLLRGTPGRITYQVNAKGEVLGVIEDIPPVPGGNLVTTIDIDTQRFVEDALVQGMRIARLDEEPVVRAAAVVLDPRDGSIIAMASVPSFDPGLFADGLITTAEWESLNEKAALNNFTIQGLYPPASAFKVVAYTLALQDSIFPEIDTVYATRPESLRDRYQGRLDATDPTSFYADGVLLFPNTPPLKDWSCGIYDAAALRCSLGGHGQVNIHTALHRSSNQYFWGIALEIWNRAGLDWREDLLQEWAKALGFGARTGVDLPFEQPGLVPDREWFQFHQQNNTGVVRSEGGWSGGDVMNIAVGQGAMVATPLQMANAYGALANGGTLWKPRVVDRIVDASNRTLFVNVPSVNRQIDIDASTVANLRNDLNGVVAGPLGTARVAFEGFCSEDVDVCEPLSQIGGKTGTAQIRIAQTEDEQDIHTAWFVGVAPLDDPQWVVAVVIDQGGSGGRVAAPTARAILQFLMGEEVDAIRSGQDTER